ncbi:MAG: hypothetical protein WD740_00705 [Anaerolineales bacterium]
MKTTKGAWTFSVSWHFTAALLLLVVPFALFTVFPSVFPHPEPISPYLSLLAVILCCWALIRLRGSRLFWRYLLIPLFGLFVFLEEISYGMELGLYDPFSVGISEVPFQDFHNFIPGLWRWTTGQLGFGPWNSAQVTQFMVINAIIVGLGVAWLLLVRSRSGGISERAWKKRILPFTLLSSALISAASIIWLASLPADPKNAILLGFSAFRLAQLAGLFIALGVVLYLWSSSARNKGFLDGAIKYLQSPRRMLIANMCLTLLLVAGLMYELFAGYTSPEETVVIERITPVAAWLLAQSVLLILALAVWRGRLRRSLAGYASALRCVLSQHPALIYVGFAALVIVIAQGFDRDVYLLPDTSRAMSGILARNWQVWTEETLEMIGSLQILAASFFFPAGKG